MINLLKLLKYDLSDKYGRLLYFTYLFRDIPGRFGAHIRLKLLSKYFAHCGQEVVIHPGVYFYGIHKLSIGSRVNLAVGTFIQASGGMTLCDDVLLGPNVKIWSVNHVFDDISLPIIEQGYDEKEVVIGKGCWLGANVIILPGVHLSEGCIVSAGSVVGIKKYPPFSIIAGNPARVIGTRLEKASVS